MGGIYLPGKEEVCAWVGARWLIDFENGARYFRNGTRNGSFSNEYYG